MQKLRPILFVLFALTVFGALASSPPHVLNNMVKVGSDDESNFPAPDGGNVGALMYGTDGGKPDGGRGRLYVNSGSSWDPL